ncbi:MAG: hypothetical protein ACE5LS_04105 [Thermoplasmata archaeon]
MGNEEDVILWLLASEDPSIRYLTLTGLLGRPDDDPRVQHAREGLLEGPRIRALLAGQEADGGFGVHPYQKWRGAHWRLVSLVELGVPPGEPRAVAATRQVLRWLTGRDHRRRIPTIRGLTRVHASMEGNALAVCSRLGLAKQEEVQLLARSLVEWQWPDGGWNCWEGKDVHHSSFYESLTPLWGLWEYHHATGDSESLRAAERTAEFFLRHRLFRSERTGEVIKEEWLKLHYPLYWHYDILQALRILAPVVRLADTRAQEALDILEKRRLPDGRWRPGAYYWYPPGKKRSNVEAVDWGRGGPNRMITLNALRVLKAAGRESDSGSRTPS